ncbi:MAG: 4-hydroxythreonine-4-phosphate dehydrogenase PdxA, partial [Petrimonas sp.]|nr:4-hydroxythreonine-4-phosphate dehydrogenase PdxA [Petrimonas sp.]
MSEQIKVGITHGDINGVGYEILLKTFADERMQELFIPVIYGSSKSASYHRKVLDHNPVSFHIINHVDECSQGKINLLNCVKDEVRIELGTPTAEAGESAFIALDNAARDLAAKKIDVLVTLPINKDTIQNDKFHFPGHTEFLQDR